MIRRLCLLLGILLGPALSYSQEVSRSSRPESSELEQLLEDAMSEGREAFLIDALSRLRENPLNINTASVDELCGLPGLDAALARRIVDFRSRSSFAAVNDLLQVEGIDDALLTALEPFVAVRTTSALGSRLISAMNMRTRLSRSLSDQLTGKSSGFLGSAEKMYNRITVNAATPVAAKQESQAGERSGLLVSLGFLTEKDPGEKNFADFISAYASVDLPASGVRLILGDYGVDAANGEVFSSSGRIVGGSNSLQYRGLVKESTRPSLASESSGNYRGAAISWLGNPVSVSVFASARPRDATIDSNGAVKAWSTDGYHRTDNELSRRHQVRETILGARARVGLAAGLDWGISWYSSKVDRTVLGPESNEMQGSRPCAVGLDMAFVHGATTFSAEFARRLEGSQSCVLSYRWSPEKTFTTSLLVRMTGADRVRSSVTGIGGSSQDPGYSFEAMASVRFRPASWMRISASYDQFRLSRHESTNDLPASGHETQLSIECQPAKRIHLELRYRQKSKPGHEAVELRGGLIRTVDGSVSQTQLRASLVVNLANGIRSRSRLELSEMGHQVEPGIERGLMMYQECFFQVHQTASFALRGIAFETSSYESRIYEFEEDVPGAFQNPALYGRGFRWFARGEILCGSWLTCSVKYAHSEMRSIDMTGGRILTSPLRRDQRWSIQVDLRW